MVRKTGADGGRPQPGERLKSTPMSYQARAPEGNIDGSGSERRVRILVQRVDIEHRQVQQKLCQACRWRGDGAAGSSPRRRQHIDVDLLCCPTQDPRRPKPAALSADAFAD